MGVSGLGLRAYFAPGDDPPRAQVQRFADAFGNDEPAALLVRNADCPLD